MFYYELKKLHLNQEWLKLLHWPVSVAKIIVLQMLSGEHLNQHVVDTC